MNTLEVIKEIVGNTSDISGIYIHSFPTAPKLENRLSFNAIEKEHYESALKLRAEHNVPFWDALMLSFYNKEQFSIRILDSVLNSHAKREKQFVSRETLLNTEFLEKLQFGSENYAISSQLETKDGNRRHLLLLDFHIPETENNQLIVEKVLELLGVKKGYLLRSGKSYHFIGSDLITTYGLISFISRCLFFTPIVDKSWIAHQLIEKSCSLRFTEKKGLYPSVIKTFQRKLEG